VTPEETTAEGARPFEGIRILDFTQVLAGPFASYQLSLLGAEVIKVEDPGIGDPMRQWGREKPYGRSLWWPVVARNKKSVTANLRTAEGQDLVRRLLADAGVPADGAR
jgi:formyl-CoA transferase